MDDGSRPRFFSWLFNSKNEETAEDEIVSILNEGQDQGTIRESEAEMITNIFELDDIEASQIMTHRKNISAVDINWSLEQTVEHICEENFSRFPVIDGSIDNITGILHIKDAVKAFLDTANKSKAIRDLPGIMQKALFVPETSKIDTVFRNMQSEKMHMAIVVDEYGQTAGIIAMEDILEEIVGNIFDEHDEVEYNIQRIDDHTFDVKGLTPLSELTEETGIEFDDEDNDTLNGYLISRLDRIPEDDVGTQVTTDQAIYTILKIEDRTIALVRIEIFDNKESEE